MATTLCKQRVLLGTFNCSRQYITSRNMASQAIEKQFKYVIVGGGTAAGYAAKHFIDNGASGRDIAIISAESAPPYERPALSKAYLDKEKPARLPGFHTPAGEGGKPQDEAWYTENQISFLAGTKATDIDLQAQVVSTSEHKLRYGSLLIATGAEATRIDLGDKEGEVHYLRHVTDADALVATMKQQPEGSRAVVIGGGYIGTEVGANILKHGIKTKFVFPESRFMERLYTPQIAKVYEDFYKQHGAEIVRGQVSHISRSNGRVDGIVLKDDSVIHGDFVVAGLGAKTDLSLFDGKLDIEGKGLKVNSFLQTSDPHVFAAGDVITFPLQLEGGKMQRQEHVIHARQSARHAVESILALESGQAASSYDYFPTFYSRFFGFSWKLFGINEGDVTHFGTFQPEQTFGAVWVRDNKLVGVFVESGTSEQEEGLALLARERPKVSDLSSVKALLNSVFLGGIEVQGE